MKPQLAGAVDEGGIPPAGYGPSAVPAFLLQAPWYCLQPTSGDADTIVHTTVAAPHGAAAKCTFAGQSSSTKNMVDMALDYAQQHGLFLQLNLYAGRFAPAWVDDLPATTGQGGPITICSTHSAVPQCGQIGHFWEADYESAYAHFMAAAARAYDANPLLRQVDIAGCMTIFDETLLRQANVRGVGPTGTPFDDNAAYLAAGYTEAADQECIRAEIRSHTVWTATRSSFAINPYDVLQAGQFVANEAMTEKFVDYCRSVLGQRCVLSNESVGNKRLLHTPLIPCQQLTRPAGGADADYLHMYSYIRCAGAPIAYWAANREEIPKNGNTEAEVLQWAAQSGGASLDMTAGFNVAAGQSGQPAPLYVPAAQLASEYTPALEANAAK